MPADNDSNRITIESYEATTDIYLALNVGAPAWLLRFLDVFASSLPPHAEILELGSGPGRDADLLESRGLRVRRTDATVAFLDLMHARGVPAAKLNVLTDDLGGPWMGIYANAVFLHLTPAELRTTLVKVRSATQPGGLLGFTVKVGDGGAWTSVKVGRERFFNYWQEPELRSLLAETGWNVFSVDRAVGRSDDWLLFLCRFEAALEGPGGP